jgi:hypothetical protein
MIPLGVLVLELVVKLGELVMVEKSALWVQLVFPREQLVLAMG